MFSSLSFLFALKNRKCNCRSYDLKIIVEFLSFGRLVAGCGRVLTGVEKS